MTVQEEVRQRIERDPLLARLRQKIESGKASYTDTAAYSIRTGKLLGEIFSRRLPEIPPEEREQLCVDLLHDRYIDINAAVDAVQRFMDEAQGLHLAPQHAPFDSERGHQIGSSLRDLSKPVETLQRRARAATETMTKAMHDDRMKAEARFRSRAGLDCRITRVAVNGCCEWCSKVAGRYAYGEEPDGIYRRHDNCDCTVTFENGRKRQDVWSKREWEVPEPGVGAGEPVRLTAEQARELEAKHQPEILTPRAKSGIIETDGQALIRQAFTFTQTTKPEDVADLIIKNHKALAEFTPESMKAMLEELGFTPRPLGKRSKSLGGIPFEQGGGYRIDFLGNGYFQYHPATGSHHNGIAYWRISCGERGDIRYDMDGELIP